MVLDALCELLTTVAEEVVLVDVPPASVMEGMVTAALEEASVVVNVGEDACNSPTVLLPTITGMVMTGVEVAAEGLLSAAIKASIVEDPVVVGTVVIGVVTGRGAGGKKPHGSVRNFLL